MLEFIMILKGMALISGGIATGYGLAFNKGLIKRLGNSMNKIKAIQFRDEHTTVFGITRHGKTWAIVRSLEKHTGAVFFYNVNDEKIKGFIKADSKSNVELIINALKQGKKINFVPTGDLEKDSKVLGAFIKHLFEQNIQLNCIFAIDEVHLFGDSKDKEGLKGCKRIATTGLRRGYKAVWITQRGALIDNTLFTQSTRVICFALGHADITYLKGHGVPTEQITGLTRQEKYLFADYDLKTVTGAFKIVE